MNEDYEIVIDRDNEKTDGSRVVEITLNFGDNWIHWELSIPKARQLAVDILGEIEAFHLKLIKGDK